MTRLILVLEKGNRCTLEDDDQDGGEEPTHHRGGDGPNSDPEGAAGSKDTVEKQENGQLNQHEGKGVGQLKAEPKLES